MASNKMQRINEDMKFALSELLREVKDPRVQQGMLSITMTETTGDLKYCKVHVSVLGLKSEKELMRGLHSASGWLRRELGMRLKLRAVPELTFVVDHSIEHGAHISRMLRELEIPKEEEEENDGQ